MTPPPAVRTRRWKRVEYERMVECGIFQPADRIELLDGRLVLKEPQSAPHATGVRLAAAALRRAFGAGWLIEAQLPVALDDDSEPEPDVSVVAGRPEDYVAAHPARPALVLEVSLHRLAFDRRRKGGLYARAGIPEYWIVDLVNRALEVRRRPRPSRTARYGWRYRDVRVLPPDATVAPLAAPAAAVRVAELLPPS
ncbi:MAG: Uma2 family endonuclease [Candidatus Rokubacteria bacterium]|nr:Uma2 family endonuclease [Candidatus Rokubacteria bacterium]